MMRSLNIDKHSDDNPKESTEFRHTHTTRSHRELQQKPFGTIVVAYDRVSETGETVRRLAVDVVPCFST